MILFEQSIQTMGLENLKKSKISNLDKWGKDPNYNICYIAGYSGSGKSITALSMAEPGDTIIHLDVYSEPDDSSTNTLRNKKFNSYLNKNVPKWKKMANATEDDNIGTLKKYSDEYWDIVDDFRTAIEEYSKNEYFNGHKVIVEGVQIADDWLVLDKSYYKNKPIVILSTNSITSFNRANKRDKDMISKSRLDRKMTKQQLSWYKNTTERLNDLIKITNAVAYKKQNLSIFEQALQILGYNEPVLEQKKDGIHTHEDIIISGKKVGRIGISIYEDIKAVGIGDFKIFPEYRNKGYGTKTIQDIINRYKSKYNLIYCYVDAKNTDAIRLYKRIGKVYDKDGPNKKNQYYVEFYKK